MLSNATGMKLMVNVNSLFFLIYCEAV